MNHFSNTQSNTEHTDTWILGVFLVSVILGCFMFIFIFLKSAHASTGAWYTYNASNHRFENFSNPLPILNSSGTTGATYYFHCDTSVYSGIAWPGWAYLSTWYSLDHTANTFLHGPGWVQMNTNTLTWSGSFVNENLNSYTGLNLDAIYLGDGDLGTPYNCNGANKIYLTDNTDPTPPPLNPPFPFALKYPVNDPNPVLPKNSSIFDPSTWFKSNPSEPMPTSTLIGDFKNWVLRKTTTTTSTVKIGVQYAKETSSLGTLGAPDTYADELAYSMLLVEPYTIAKTHPLLTTWERWISSNVTWYAKPYAVDTSGTVTFGDTNTFTVSSWAEMYYGANLDPLTGLTLAPLTSSTPTSTLDMRIASGVRMPPVSVTVSGGAKTITQATSTCDSFGNSIISSSTIDGVICKTKNLVADLEDGAKTAVTSNYNNLQSGLSAIFPFSAFAALNDDLTKAQQASSTAMGITFAAGNKNLFGGHSLTIASGDSVSQVKAKTGFDLQQFFDYILWGIAGLYLVYAGYTVAGMFGHPHTQGTLSAEDKAMALHRNYKRVMSRNENKFTR